MRSLFLAGVATIALGAGLRPAHATDITTVSNFDVDWSLSLSGTVTAKAVVNFSNFVFAGNTVTYNVTVTNTSTGTSAGNDVRFTSFGWDTVPTTSVVTDSSTVYASVANSALGPDSVSVCMYAGPNCNGGSSGGLEDPHNTGLHGDPTTTSFSITETFTAIVPPLTFNNFDGKFQSFLGSIEGSGTVVDHTPVPEPASLAIFGMGMAGLGMIRRRRA